MSFIFSNYFTLKYNDTMFWEKKVISKLIKVWKIFFECHIYFLNQLIMRYNQKIYYTSRNNLTEVNNKATDSWIEFTMRQQRLLPFIRVLVSNDGCTLNNKSLVVSAVAPNVFFQHNKMRLRIAKLYTDTCLFLSRET